MLRKRISNIMVAVVTIAMSLVANLRFTNMAWADESRVEVVSVTQDGVELSEVEGFYEVPDYTKEITAKFLVKDLKAGYTYDYAPRTGASSRVSFTVETEGEDKELTMSGKPTLRSSMSTLFFNLSGYKPGEIVASPMLFDSVNASIDYRVIDERFVALDHMIIDELSQGSVALEPNCEESEYQNTCTYSVNDVQPIKITIHTTSAIDAQEYTISGYYLGDYWSGNRGETTYTGAELKSGVTLTLPVEMDRLGTARLMVNLKEGEYSTSSLSTTYDESDFKYVNLMLSFVSDPTIPRYSSVLSYENYPDVEVENGMGRISPLYHNAENPLAVKISGSGYLDDETYEVKINVERDAIPVKEFNVSRTGADLNAGTRVVLDGVTMDFPSAEEFAENVESAYYEIFVSIDELSRTLGGYYDYGSNVSSVVMTPSGVPIVSVGGGGAGGPRVSMESSTIARKLVEGESGIDIYYVTTDYDEEAILDYEVYLGETDQRGYFYNSLPEDFTLIGSGEVSGKDLNSGVFKVNFKNTENYVQPAVITFLKSEGRVVSQISDYIVLWDGAGIVSSDIYAKGGNSEVYMQMMSQSYYVPKGNSVELRYQGMDFDVEETYTVSQRNGNVQYCGMEKPEGINAWGRLSTGEYCWYNESNESALVEPITISGKDLNDGKLAIELPYDEKVKDAYSVSMYFTVKDSENQEYNGAFVYLTYVDGNDFFTTSKGYKINNNSLRMSGISEKTKASELVGDVNVENGGSVVVLNGDVAIEEDKNIGTNMTVEIVDEYDRPVLDVTAVVNGDLTGSGEINSADLLKMQRHLISGKELDGAFLEAADVISNDKIDSTDLLQMRKHLIGTAEIK